jgi:hypothetical protein
MSNLKRLEQQEQKPKHTANIRGRRPAGTIDEDEGRRGLLRHQEVLEDSDGEFEEEGLRDAV